MKKFLLAGVALVGLASAAAAADLPRRSAAPAPYAPVAPAFTWTGLYVGVNAGYGFGGDDRVRTTGQSASNILDIAGAARPGTRSLERSGFTGGGQVGYNYQFSNRIVAGLEADIAYTDFGSTQSTTSAALGTGLALNSTFKQDLSYLGTVRGRIGYAFDRALVYGTGGLAYGDANSHVDFRGPAPGNALQFTGDKNGIKTGYALGAGIEYAVTNNVTVKGEYLYYNLGRDNLNVAAVAGSGAVGTGYNSRFANDGHIIRAGVNYKFSDGLF